MPTEPHRCREAFAIFVGDVPRLLHVGDVVAGSDPILRSHRHLFMPMSEWVATTTARPVEVRAVPQPNKEIPMPHALSPEHEDSPASPFAPGQPAAGIVADDVPPEQNPAGKPKAADAPVIHNVSPIPQTPQQEANAKAQEKAAQASDKPAKAK